MQNDFTLHKDYTFYGNNYQLVLPLDLACMIPVADSVRLLSQFIEGMFLGDLYRTYCSEGREDEPAPRQMLKIMVYAYMNHKYSNREIESACQRDINFMWLLEGAKVPDHFTIAGFCSLHFALCAERIMAEISQFLYQMGELSGFIFFFPHITPSP
ncbi:MAG: transposase [Roseburia sp.]|nr:transposase [Roseburia sp.]MCM1202097.1 transposase [Bacteroides fragilis]